LNLIDFFIDVALEFEWADG